MTPCSIPTCRRPVRARGLCATHYQSARRSGSLPALEGTVPMALRVPASTHAALEREAKKAGTSAYAVALRVLATWARRR